MICKIDNGARKTNRAWQFWDDGTLFSKNRPDGTLVRKAPKLRLYMPYLMPRRGDAQIFFEQKIDVSQTLEYLERWNSDPTRPHLSMFHILMGSQVQGFHEFPRMNRFIAGRRLYQRNEIALSMSVLERKKNEAKIKVVKKTYQPTKGLIAVQKTTDESIHVGRSSKKTSADRKVAMLLKLPGFLIPFLPGLQKLGDRLNIAPASIIRHDPLYASSMTSYLGSIGLDAAYHHLYEHGTIPIFSVFGISKMEPVVLASGQIAARPIVTARFTFDERIADGYYAANALMRFIQLIENPWLLETAADNGPGAPEGFSATQEDAKFT